MGRVHLQRDDGRHHECAVWTAIGIGITIFQSNMACWLRQHPGSGVLVDHLVHSTYGFTDETHEMVVCRLLSRLLLFEFAEIS